MRIGLVVDGQAEFRSLPYLFGRIECSHTILSPLYADIQPTAPVGQIVGTVRRKLPILSAKRVDALLVLIDREERTECPGEFATLIQLGLAECCESAGIANTGVVIKNRTFENWLIADTQALKTLPARFSFAGGTLNRIEGRADSLNAIALLQRHANNRAYSKITDAMSVLQRADPYRIAQNSRSFRRFLRQLGCARYRDQSRRAVP